MERDRTGKGQRVDVAMLDSSLLLMASHMTRYLTTGNEPKASGNNAFSGSPTSGVFETADGLLALAANNDRQLPRLLSAIGREELAKDPRFADAAERKTNTDALRDELAKTFRSDTADAWETRLAAADVPAGRVRGLAEAVDMEQVTARGLMADYTLPKLNRRISAPTLGFKANGDVVRSKTPPPYLGQDTEIVLSEFGKTPEDIAKLRAAGAIR
jgi:formyl-CoA transferase